MDDAGEIVGQQFLENVGPAAGAAGEEREVRGDEGPDPCFGRALLRRRFVDVRSGFFGKSSSQFVVSGLDRFGGAVLQTDQPRGARGLIENHAHELRRSPLRLTKARHQESGEGDEPRAGLAGGHALGEFAAGAASARADKSMPLIFDDDGRDLGKIPDLMTERGGIDAGERLAAPTTCRREDRNDLLTLLRRQQRTLVLFMTGLTAAFSGGLGLGRRRLVVRMSRRGRLRRIGGRGALQPSELGFKFRDTSGQTNDLFALPAKQSQHARRRRGKIGFGDLRRCIHASCKNTRSAILTLHRSVNGYVPR